MLWRRCEEANELLTGTPIVSRDFFDYCNRFRFCRLTMALFTRTLFWVINLGTDCCEVPSNFSIASVLACFDYFMWRREVLALVAWVSDGLEAFSISFEMSLRDYRADYIGFLYAITYLEAFTILRRGNKSLSLIIWSCGSRILICYPMLLLSKLMLFERILSWPTGATAFNGNLAMPTPILS